MAVCPCLRDRIPKSMEQHLSCCSTEATGAQGHGHRHTMLHDVKFAATASVCPEFGDAAAAVTLPRSNYGQMVPAGAVGRFGHHTSVKPRRSDEYASGQVGGECCSCSLLMLVAFRIYRTIKARIGS